MMRGREYGREYGAYERGPYDRRPYERGSYERVPYERTSSWRRGYERLPSPWVPATILGIILLIVFMPYMKRTPDPAIAYQTALAYQQAQKAPSFPLSLLWIPVIGFIALQFFGGNQYIYDRFGRPGMRDVPGGMYGRGGARRDGMYNGGGGGVGMYRNRAFGPDRMAPDNRGWFGGWPWSTTSWSPDNRFNNQNQRGLLSVFMDYGGHWLLILLGIGVFALVSSSSMPNA